MEGHPEVGGVAKAWRGNQRVEEGWPKGGGVARGWRGNQRVEEWHPEDGGQPEGGGAESAVPSQSELASLLLSTQTLFSQSLSKGSWLQMNLTLVAAQTTPGGKIERKSGQ